MNRHAILHTPKSNQAYGTLEDTLHIRLRTAKNDVSLVTLKAFDPFNWVPGDNPTDPWVFDTNKAVLVSMTKEHSNDLFDYWFGEVKGIITKRIRYGFFLTTSEETYFYGANTFLTKRAYDEKGFDGSQYFNFPFINREDLYKAPAWVKDTVWYQIYPERFANGDPSLNSDKVLPWNSVKEVSNHDHFGGDLQGIIDHLDHLVSLGIGGIYFTPIFESPSTHKYDTTNYFKIDPSFGTNEDFKRLVEEAHKRHIRVMLDGVFNHCGFLHPFWQDVVEKGAQSEYLDCFFVHQTPVVNFDLEKGKQGILTSEEMYSLPYDTFGYSSNMPKLNTDHPLMRDHILDVARYWTQEYGIDGWRLDVSNEVAHDFWRSFRKTVKAINPEVYIIGENWDNSYPWLMGDQFDAVMNYELLNVIWSFIGDHETLKHKSDVEDFINRLGNYLVAYPKPVIESMFNMVDSHDTHRVMTICNHRLSLVKLVYAIQLALPGAPSILYGSEIGLAGYFESARACMVFDGIEEAPLYHHLKDLIHIRKVHPSMRSSTLSWPYVDKEANAFVMKKETKEEVLYFALNNNDQAIRIKTQDFTFDLAPYGYAYHFVSQ